MEFKNKYIKYKLKYLNLKRIKGGAMVLNDSSSSSSSNDDSDGLLYKKNSQFQKIRLYRKNNDIWLELNGQIQFHSKEYKISHKIQCELPVKKYKPKKVLILGGGDGLAASCILKYPFVESVTIVEIDEEMINMIHNLDIMRLLTDNVVDNKKLNIIIGDAIKYVFDSKEKYDLIIEDIELEHTKQVFDFDFYEFYKKLTSMSDIISITIPDDTDDTDVDNKNIKSIYPTFYEIYKRNEKFNKLGFYLNKNIINIFKELKFSDYFLEKIKKNNILENFNMFLSAYNFGYNDDDYYGLEMYIILKRE